MKNEPKVLIDFVIEQAESNPHNAAVISQAGEVTYAHLMSLVSSLSAELTEKGVIGETPVAVCADRSLAWIVGVLGVLHAGGIYVPVDPLCPQKRKLRMLEDTGVRFILTDAPGCEALPPYIQTVRLDLDRTDTHSASKGAKIVPSQAAYGIYTSGSTGMPKNVIVTHESLSNYAAVLRRELGLTADDRCLHTASLAFSASLRQLLAPLVSGAGVVLATRDQVRDPHSLIAWMVETGTTAFDTVPSYLERWVTAILQAPREWREKLSRTLRLVMTTGEPLLADTVKRVRSVFPDVRILNLYGQTETTGAVAIHEVPNPETDPIPIGGPLMPCEFYVLNERMEPSDAGELYVSGPCIARGYHGLADTTATHFLPNPFSETPGVRMYRTGDRVRSLNDGLLEFKGRTDRQVKVNGIRIELGEIDATLLQHPGVREAVTVLRSVGGNDLRLVAFIVRTPGRDCGSDELQEFAATMLAEPMVPRLLVFVHDLPRTESGKIDRPALMVADVSSALEKVSSSTPSTTMERLVARCWEDELKVKGVGVEDDFFALGGSSIQAIQMIYRLQELLPAQLPLGPLFFQDPILKGFAAQLSELLQIE